MKLVAKPRKRLSVGDERSEEPTASLLRGFATSFMNGILILGVYTEGQSAGFFMSLVGAMIILFIYHEFLIRKPPTP